MAKVGAIITENGKQYELVPPEGGWGYLTCLALILNFIACTSHTPAFGIIYNGFLDNQNQGTSGIAVVFGVASITIALAGFGANILLKQFSLRQVGLLGASLYSTGVFLGIFIQSTTHMVFTGGLLQPAGIGILMPIIYTSFNSYFTQKRMFLLSISKVVVGLANMVAPILIKISMQEFGFRATLSLLAAVGFHSILAVALLQPVEWHLVKREVVDKREEENPEDDKMYNEEDTKLKDHQISEQYLSDNEDDQEQMRIPLTRLSDNKTNKRRDSEEEREIQSLVQATSVANLANFTNANIEILPSRKTKYGKWKAFVELLDLSLLKDPIYINIIFGISLTLCSDISYFIYLPLLLYKMKWSDSKVALAISLVAGSDMLGRVSLAIVTRFKTIPSRMVFFTGVICTVGFRILFEISENEYAMLTLIGLLGFLRSFIHVTMPLVTADHVPVERYPAAYSLMMLIFGLMNLSAGTLIGVIRDYTNSYHVAFHALTAVLIFCAISWSLEFYFTRRKTKRVGVK